MTEGDANVEQVGIPLSEVSHNRPRALQRTCFCAHRWTSLARGVLTTAPAPYCSYSAKTTCARCAPPQHNIRRCVARRNPSESRSAKVVNAKLISAQLLEERSRTSRSGPNVAKTYKTLTATGLAFGENVPSSHSEETQLNHFSNKFLELLDAASIQRP